MIKKFESFKSIGNLTEIIEVIDYVMLNFKDMGFEEIDMLSTASNMTFFKKWIRYKKTNNLIQLDGWIENGKVSFLTLNPNNRYTEIDSDICDEFIDSIHAISSATDEKIHFSFTNYYNEDKIIIYIPNN